MRDAADDLFDQLVYAVACLLFGDHPGTHTIYQRVVADAMRHRGVDKMIATALEGK